MATYKQPCIHCRGLLDRDARFCPACGSSSPFGYACPACLRAVERGWMRCAGCGRPLYTACPHCGQQTFAAKTCGACGKTLMVICPNKRCGAAQFFENQLCTACGKQLKK